jgi:hypothetical protein
MYHRRSCRPRALTRRLLYLALGACCGSLLAATARDLYVNPATGADAANGLAASPAGTNGPVKTIARGLKLAGPGDTVHLAPVVFKESATFHNRSGEPGRPIVLDGQGATLDGSDPLKPADWQMVTPGLYRNDHLLKADDFALIRWFFIFDGRMSHMGRCSKGTRVPFKKPEDLQPGEWTFAAAVHAFYVRIAPEQQFADARISAPVRPNGVGFGGSCQHLVVRHLTATHVYNDGFNIHGSTRDLVFEDIRAIECGDDGFSAHEDCEVRVDGFYASGNATGICSINSVSENDHVFIKDCIGHDLFFPECGRHSVRNSRIISSAEHTITVSGRPKEHTGAILTLDNVMVSRSAGANAVSVPAGGTLAATNVTLLGLDLQVAGTATLRNSIVAGQPQPKLSIAAGANWQAGNNLYAVSALQSGKTAFTRNTFSEYQQATGQDAQSRWVSEDEALTWSAGHGADGSKLPAAPQNALRATP